MENANPSCSTSNREFLDPKKKKEIESWLEDSSIEEGSITFKKDDEKITFKMPHKMEAFNRIYFKDINTDSIPPFVLGNNDDREKTYYLDTLTLGPKYREDESISKVLETNCVTSLLICLGNRESNTSSTLESFPQESLDTTHAKFTARINKLLTMRQTIDSLLFKTINEMTNQSSDSEIFCPKKRIKELQLRTQRRNNFEEELFKNRFPTEKELAYHKELLGEPKPPFSTLEPTIRRGGPWSLKIPCAIGTVYMGHAYIDLQSPINIMSRAYYNKIREKPFQARRNPYQPYMFCNFVRRDKNMHMFIGCFIYVVDFMILEDLGSIIDSGLSKVVLGQPFAHTSKLTYDESLGLIRFSQRDDEVVFRMPQRKKELDRVSPLEKDKFEAFFVDSLNVRKMRFKHVLEKRKRYYKACMNLGRNYKRDRETIEKLKTNHVSIIKLKE
ncbi:hypothetical protein Tco_0718150 [Tanacetum coccineum]